MTSASQAPGTNQTSRILPAGTGIGTVTLRVSDAERAIQWYGEMMGMELIGRTPERLSFGAGGRAFLLLDVRPDATPRIEETTGLYHVAILVPDRAVLGGVLDRRPENPKVASLVEHLQDTGARYYGASWCGSCARQNRLFGASAARLPYVECSPQGRGGPIARECREAGVASYPSWEINGLLHTGVQTPQDLARLSGFDWDGG